MGAGLLFFLNEEGLEDLFSEAFGVAGSGDHQRRRSARQAAFS